VTADRSPIRSHPWRVPQSPISAGQYREPMETVVVAGVFGLLGAIIGSVLTGIVQYVARARASRAERLDSAIRSVAIALSARQFSWSVGMMGAPPNFSPKKMRLKAPAGYTRRGWSGISPRYMMRSESSRLSLRTVSALDCPSIFQMASWVIRYKTPTTSSLHIVDAALAETSGRPSGRRNNPDRPTLRKPGLLAEIGNGLSRTPRTNSPAGPRFSAYSKSSDLV